MGFIGQWYKLNLGVLLYYTRILKYGFYSSMVEAQLIVFKPSRRSSIYIFYILEVEPLFM